MVGRWTGGDVTVSFYSFSFTHQRSDRPSLLFLKYSTSYFVLLSELRPRHIQFEKMAVGKPKGLRPSSAANANVAAAGPSGVSKQSTDKSEKRKMAAADKKDGNRGVAAKKSNAPPKLTASFVMGVQRRPGTTAAAKKARRLRSHEGPYMVMVKDAATVDSAAAAVVAARAAALEAVSSARVAAKAAAKAATHAKGEARVTADQKGLTRQQIIKACGVVSRLAHALSALRDTEAAEARARLAAERLARYTASWMAMIESHGTTGAWMGADGKREVGDVLPVGHKLRQLLMTCGADLTEESCTLIFSQLGGAGSSCDYESFMRVVCEHSPGVADASGAATSTSRGGRAVLKRTASSIFKAASSPLTPQRSSPKLGGSSSKKRLTGSPASPPQQIRWVEFRAMIVDDKAIAKARTAKALADMADSDSVRNGRGGASEAATSSDPTCGLLEGVASLLDSEARLLFLRCGGNEEYGSLGRSEFEKAVAADQARRKRLGLTKADPASLEC